MKDMKKYRYFRILTAALLLTGAAVTACQLDEGDNVPLIELGAASPGPFRTSASSRA